MAKIKAKLRNMNMRGETTSTKWGFVSFDRDGLAELEVDEEDLPTLRLLKWLVEEPTQPQEVTEGDPPPPPTAGETEAGETRETGAGETGETEKGFDTSDAEPTPEALEAIEAEAIEAEAAEAEAAESAAGDKPKPSHSHSKKSGKRR